MKRKPKPPRPRDSVPSGTPPQEGNFTQDSVQALLSGSASVQEVLDRIVTQMATTWDASGCSVFLFNEKTRKLSLRASHGVPALKPGHSVMDLGEGFIGSALQDLRFRFTLNASLETDFAHCSEECLAEYGSVLAIPILRGNERIGVMVVQRPSGTPFSPEEMNSLRTLTTHVATSIETIRAMTLASDTLERERDAVAGKKVLGSKRYRGTAVSTGAGIALGVTRVLAKMRARTYLLSLKNGEDAPHEHRSLDDAIALSIAQMERLQMALSDRLPEAATMIFESHLLMLKDEVFVGKIRQGIGEGMSAVRAVALAATEFIEFFSQSEHDYLKEKAGDVEDLALRLLENLHQHTEAASVHDTASSIIITAELLPSDILRIAQENCQGIVLVGGGNTAHVTLLVRSLNIPMIIVGDDNELLRLPDNVPMILDCTTGHVLFCPDQTVIDAYYAKIEARSKVHPVSSHVASKTVTRDGERIHLMANINLLTEVAYAREMKAEGIGLYRTEFPYLIRQALPTEAEQVQVYCRLLDQMPNRPMTLRTLDVGGDKVLSYFDHAREENPALGLRSTRFTLRYPYLFDQQLRAMLWAIQERRRRDVRIMFPMIGSLEDFRAVRQRVDACLREIQGRLGKGSRLIRPAIGAMVEVPSLVHIIGDLVPEADFFSIGTNDFIQYMLAVDRTNADVASYYVPHHPAVLRGLAAVIRPILAAGKDVSICGEMGSDPRYIPFFIGLGIRTLSVNPGAIAEMQRAISRLTLPQCKTYARALLRHSALAQIEAALRTS